MPLPQLLSLSPKIPVLGRFCGRDPQTQTQICLSPTSPDCHSRESSAEGGTMPRPGFTALVSAPVLLSHGASEQNCLEYINIANSVSVLINNDI